MDKPKYKRGDKVRFHVPETVNWGGEVVHAEMDIEGVVEIVDAFGTFMQHDEPSYDIYNKANNMLYKHCRQSDVIEYLGVANDDERIDF